MIRDAEHTTREHLLATGERLCLQRGFIGLGLSELLKTAGVPKGSFYHYFRSKEAFGICMLAHRYARYLETLHQHFSDGHDDHRQCLLNWYQQNLQQYCSSSPAGGCLMVKLSAEVCDLSEDMRLALDCGTAQVIDLLSEAISCAVREQSITPVSDPRALARVLYALWLGAICRRRSRAAQRR